MPRNLGIEAVKRYLTLKTNRIYTLPIAILMPHGGCNCRCVMCDIWKGNARRQMLSGDDVDHLLSSFRDLGTRWVVMSGGEALMNPRLFEFCDILRKEGIWITILSTGLLVSRFAQQIVEKSDELIVSLDGSRDVHNEIRRVPDAFRRLHEGIISVKSLDRSFPVSGRCVIQRMNFRDWPNIVDAARKIGLDRISFLAADVTSEAFNREEPWDEVRAGEVSLNSSEVDELRGIVDRLINVYRDDFESGFIAESPEKIKHIYSYFAALAGDRPFPPVRCNAPWVSAVVEADGTVRPCFFHRSSGNIRQHDLAELINSPTEVEFRRNLDMDQNPTCRKCVCTLRLAPTARLAPEIVRSV